MNNGLPSLLDAIFGKKDLESVSLEEMHEVIAEFPSFNAAHYLLSKKLKGENSTNYEKENKRTALFFNNSFWLQTLLNEGDPVKSEKTMLSNKKQDQHEETMLDSVNENKSFTGEWQENSLDQEELEIINEQTEAEVGQQGKSDAEETETISERQNLHVPSTEFETKTQAGVQETVSSFDDLLLKYRIPEEELTENPPEDQILINSSDTAEGLEKTEPTVPSFEKTEEIEFISPNSHSSLVENENKEVTGEVLNEYGIFEEESAEKKSDFDPDSFELPNDWSPEPAVEIVNPESHSETEMVIEDEIASTDNEISPALDPEVVNNGIEDDTEDEIPEIKPLPIFDAKTSESIVFAPYHMIDYFASQGIKLVLEDQPADQFGKQLKSFTDWLKVMKKLPARPLSDKTDDKDVDRVRHFAAHSIEERDILTESMAEVLVKQGMYENAISLYQKLSLIYPPKSAYFASRIEQIKVLLP